MFSALPLLIIPVLLYNGLVLFTPLAGGWDAVLFSVPMISGAEWATSRSDALMALTLAMLFLEIVKATRTGSVSILDHALSTLLLVACLLEFVLVPEAATSTFALITLIVLFDVVAGYTVTIRAARRDVALGPAGMV